MTDRATVITGTQAARAFPCLAKFLADNTSIVPDVAEHALRIACQDYAAAEDAINTRAGWSRAVAMANGSTGQLEAGSVADKKPLGSWAAAVAAANGHVGAMVSTREAVGAILAESLYHHLPDQFDAADGGRHRHALGLMLVHDPVAREPEVFSWEQRRSPPLSPAAAIHALLTSRLRKRAKAVAGSDPEGDVPEVKIVEPYRAPPPPPEIEVVGLKHFKFLDGEEGYKPRFSCVMKGSRSMVRVEIAQHAIAVGAAALVDSVEGKKCLSWRASVQSWGIGPELSEYDDIGDPLGLQAFYEAAKAGDAARNNQVEAEEVERVLG